MNSVSSDPGNEPAHKAVAESRAKSASLFFFRIFHEPYLPSTVIASARPFGIFHLSALVQYVVSARHRRLRIKERSFHQIAVGLLALTVLRG